MQKRYKNARRLTRPRPGGFNPEKNISQIGVLFPIYGKIIHMFQTTNRKNIRELGVENVLKPAQSFILTQ